MSVSWCYLGNKHVYHVFGLDPWYWLVAFSFGVLYSTILLTFLVLIFWVCVITYTFQETPRLTDDSDSSSDDSESDEGIDDHHHHDHHHTPSVRRTRSVPTNGRTIRSNSNSNGKERPPQEGLLLLNPQVRDVVISMAHSGSDYLEIRNFVRERLQRDSLSESDKTVIRDMIQEKIQQSSRSESERNELRRRGTSGGVGGGNDAEEEVEEELRGIFGS